MVITTRSEKIDLRLTPQDKASLQEAARAVHRSVSEFVLVSALDHAQNVLADRQRFGLSSERWIAFQEALDAPDRELPRIRELLKRPSVFEQSVQE